MLYDSILARSFSKHEQKRLRHGAIICCLIMVLFFCSFFKPSLSRLPNVLNLKVPVGIGLKMPALKATNNSQKMLPRSSWHESKYWTSHEKTRMSDHSQVSSTISQPKLQTKDTLVNETRPLVLCKTDDLRTELCEIKTNVRIDSKSSSIFAAYASSQDNNNSTIRPYPRKDDGVALRQVRKWSILGQEKGLDKTPRCTRNHSVPAVLFSLGGYAGNNFHDFSDVIIPLFITSKQYNGEVQFLIADYKLYFVVKFEKILKELSNYKPINIDKEDQQVHCFQSATIGLKRHQREMAIDPEKHSTSMIEFREFLRKSYSLSKRKAIKIRDDLQSKKPRLLILSRRKTRAFTNTDEIKAMAISLGYEVIVSEASSNLSRFAEIVSSCDVLMGVHGAGLANIVFLPDNAVFIQVLPIGGFEWLAKTDFGLPSKDMNVSYLEYKISKEESTLINQYPVDHQVLNDPKIIQKIGWISFKSIFLEKQNVNLDVNRFKPTLVKALELLHG